MKERIWGVFHATGGQLLFATGTKGGCGIKNWWGVADTHPFNSFVFCGLLRLFGFENDDTEKSGETIGPPPKRGVPTDPDSGTQWHVPLSRPVGGRYRLYLSLREGSEKTPRSGAD